MSSGQADDQQYCFLYSCSFFPLQSSQPKRGQQKNAGVAHHCQSFSLSCPSLCTSSVYICKYELIRLAASPTSFVPVSIPFFFFDADPPLLHILKLVLLVYHTKPAIHLKVWHNHSSTSVNEQLVKKEKNVTKKVLPEALASHSTKISIPFLVAI